MTTLKEKIFTVTESREDTDEIIQIFESELNDLVVEERINHRSICSRTIRKIKEKILHNDTIIAEAERTSPEPKD